jgi:NAD(P)-dependent dehydrogenase (short-subunit alcohol dehydrogenase family)
LRFFSVHHHVINLLIDSPLRAQGGAQGIGASTVALLHDVGAHVFLGDWDAKKGCDLETELKTNGSRQGGTVTFQKVDVRDYSSQLALFDAAFNRHGSVDAAVYCAAVV